ncbi:MAG: hypothetical protein ACOCZA_08770 [Spirochaetota bacterium]
MVSAMKPARTRIASLLFLVLLSAGVVLLSGCPSEKQTTAVLCTNRPEFTSYVELFNSAQDEYRLIISYHDTPRRNLSRNSECEFDLIIDSHLNSQQYLNQLASLENLFIDKQLEPDRFYAVPLEQGRFDNQQVLLPISFQIPGLMFHTDRQLPDQDSFLIDIEQVKSLNEEFSVSTEKGLTRLGLSLRWDPSLLYQISLLMGADFRESSTGSLMWNSESLKNSVDLIRNWTFEINNGLTAEREFTQKFLIEPPYKLISKERILCYYTDAEQFYSISPQHREDLKLRWLAENDSIPVLPSMLFAGIPHGAPGIKAAKAFLAWFSDVETQEQLLASTQYKRTRTFGVAGGFSALPRVNEQVLPTYYPSLVGYIPSASYLDFAPPMPSNWPQIRDQVIIPWLEEQAASEQTDELMRERLETWLRQRPSS